MPPSQLTNGTTTKKRKRTTALEKTRSEARSKVVKKPVVLPTAEDVLVLEEAIAESPQHYNKIVTLLEYVQNASANLELAVTSAVSLCRVFCRLMANGSLLRKKSHDAAQSTILEWLKDRYKDYTKELSALIAHEDPAVQTTALTLYMRLVKEDGAHMKPAGDEYYFPQMLFGKLMRALLYSEHLDDAVKQEFTSKYLNAHDDIRYAFYTAVSALIAEAPTPTPVFIASVLALLLTLENVPTADAPLLGSTYTTAPAPSAQKQPPIHAKPTHRKLLQETWLATLRLPLTKDQIKTILAVMSIRIVPCFTRPQLLMDFLVDAYDAGGSISLLALNGLFYLIQTKNLDYPNFYTKLYALLTRDVFHVRYRSRFFRLLDTFLESTHLPAAMVASFIKRMARLALSAPPAAVVIVVPFVYNLLKRHPSCTFMVHREGSAEEREEWRKEGLTDVFEEREEDPMKTRAIESSLWEIEMLMAHWHPNVGTLARIIGEQFTKEKYILEDFLDHSYASMFAAEVNKSIKKPPVVEFDIPKKIFFKPAAAADEEQLQGEVSVEENPLLALWSFE
ncbi:uncharacterized protein H6S33_002604 [Morchella sextelata]|uniref:uncharacterized protein n=1 Tax=Morchella sextelata TaxID=1174677 RepID=UPI001D040BA1|nr:uncharacterized protein H6S33_002604 [Morchella sextelata]KAH0607570.1 hypothetical protein H6S33_002604 [Morchella sextelata]